MKLAEALSLCADLQKRVANESEAERQFECTGG
ncbi:DIP1984 family protein [Bacteroides sp. Marseille-P8574]|nr:DIP1984 family protein [Bacteroides sp. Marseille-P8574]